MLTSLVYKDKEQAKGHLLSALRANRLHHRSWYYLAQLYAHDFKEPRMADWLYRKALKLNPAHVNSHKDYGNLLLFSHKDSAEAELHYRTAVQLQPNHIKALTALGWCLAKKAKTWRDFDTVVDCYRKAAHSNYGDQATRRVTQQTFMSTLIVKGQLHCDRREVERARSVLRRPLLSARPHCCRTRCSSRRRRGCTSRRPRHWPCTRSLSGHRGRCRGRKRCFYRPSPCRRS